MFVDRIVALGWRSSRGGLFDELDRGTRVRDFDNQAGVPLVGQFDDDGLVGIAYVPEDAFSVEVEGLLKPAFVVGCGPPIGLAARSVW
jgi:hypothetical protein